MHRARMLKRVISSAMIATRKEDVMRRLLGLASTRQSRLQPIIILNFFNKSDIQP